MSNTGDEWLMKKCFILILVFMFVFTSLTFSAALKVDNLDINFNIEPETIKNNSFVPIEQFKELENFSMYSIEENRLLIIYNSNYYAFSLNNKEIRSNTGNFNICCKPIKLNEHVLVPYELVEKIFAKEISETNDNKKLIDIELRLTQQKIDDKEVLNVDIILNNQAEEKITLEFSTSQKYNILIKDENNNIIYNWEKGKMFTQAFTYNTIEKNSSIKFAEKIDVTDLKAGTYNLIISMENNNYEIKNKEVEFIIDK